MKYKIVLDGVAAPQSGKQGWSLEGDLASYFKEDWNTAGWSLASDSLSVESLSASGQSTADVELSGIDSTNGMAPKDKVISLTSANYSSTSVSVVSNTSGYSFHLSGDLSGKSFLGSESADSIVVAGKNISVEVVNARFVKPFDTELAKNSARSAKLFVTCEEGTLAGGFGSAMAEFFADEKISTPLLRLGIADKFVEQGTRAELLNLLGLTPQKIAQRIHERLNDLIFGFLTVTT